MALKGSQLTSYKDQVITEEGTNTAHPKFQKWLDVLYEFVVRRQKVIDLTNATSDYKLKVGECAKVRISAATTALHIACEDGVYEVRVIFDHTTFAADSDFGIRANNVDDVGAFIHCRIRGATDIATDEIDTTDAAVDKHMDGAASRYISVVACIMIMGNISVASGIMFAIDVTTNVETVSISGTRYGTLHTSLGTILLSEAATGMAYVRRTA